MRHNDLLEQWDRAHFFHPSTHLAQFARGDAPERIATATACSTLLPACTA